MRVHAVAMPFRVSPIQSGPHRMMKRRHAGRLERNGQSLFATRELRHHHPRREAGEAPDFSREMRLVGVPAGRSQGGERQARTGVHTSDESLKAENASERLRTVAK